MSQTRSRAAQISTLIALARSSRFADRRLLKYLPDEQAKDLAEALMDEGVEAKLSQQKKQQLHSVRQLAGVTE